jgi:hypothetical protein
VAGLRHSGLVDHLPRPTVDPREQVRVLLAVEGSHRQG